MTNCAFVISSGVLNDYISDHYTVYSVWKKKKKNKEGQWKTCRQYKNYNYNDFETLLQAKNWNIFDNMIDLDSRWLFMKNLALEILSIMCPYKTIHVRKISSPWITPDIFKLIKSRLDFTCMENIQKSFGG